MKMNRNTEKAEKENKREREAVADPPAELESQFILRLPTVSN